MEVWRNIVEFEGAYKVSNFGRILDVESGKIRKLCRDKDGYYQLGMMKNGKRVFRKVHRLVAETFLDNPDGLPFINHKNEIKTDNRPENLEWCTQAYNNSYGSRVRPVLQINSDGEIIRKFPSMAEAAKSVSTCTKNIQRCCMEKGKTIEGYRWEFSS